MAPPLISPVLADAPATTIDADGDSSAPMA
jgi:hypothetical protein